MNTQPQSSVPKTAALPPGNYSPVKIIIHESLGTIFLGVLCLILLVGWLKADARYRNDSRI